ncbi:MAG: GNAT family N-acetyltransferase [Saprospiraceae bacterium]|nr:GNAT family N-acetyltransferase [Saprospiraceae bacterium]
MEALFVKQKWRHSSFATELLKNGETWAKSSGISQIASDTEVENVESIAFYKKAGFSEVNRVVCFIKDL